MSGDKESLNVLAKVAYAKAWTILSDFRGQTPDEKVGGPQKLRDYIQMMIQTGERDADAISALALGLMRQQEQICRSRAVLESRAGSFKLGGRSDGDQANAD
jgi:hypothetical protein